MVGYSSPGLQYFQSEYRGEDWGFEHHWAASGNILYNMYKDGLARVRVANVGSDQCSKVWNLRLKCRENATSGILILKFFTV